MIKGVILQNFMSYENAFIQLRNGLNIICGPNGAGKSSILLAISIILGQTYTERSRRLSDLIRWGTDQARITLQINNKLRNGKKLFPYYRSDLIEVTRVFKKNGNYFYLIQNKKVPKNAVMKVIKRLGINPENMLLIMHQLMVIKFSSVSPQDKLRMLEEAIGFQSYRQHVLEASERLTKVVSEEKSLASALESTKETHDFWQREHEKYLKRKKLESRLRQLQSELLWAKVENKESVLSQLEARRHTRKKTLIMSEDRFSKARSLCEEKESSFKEIRQEYKKLEEEKLDLTRDEATYRVGMTWARKTLDETKNDILNLKKGIDVESRMNNVQFIKEYKKNLVAKQNEMISMLEEFEKESKRIRKEEASIQKRLLEIEKNLDETLSEFIQSKINVEILTFKKNVFIEELQGLEAKVGILKEELEPISKEARGFGPRIETIRKPIDIVRDVALVKEQLRPLTSVSEDVEKMHESYTTLYKELKEKAEIVSRNRKITMVELSKRVNFWRGEINKFISELNVAYNDILVEIGATGHIKLMNEKIAEKAGLDMQVGFGGRHPVSLDSLAQSGGERSVALMAFLLALQQHIASPFRAIDEFDVHMDPRNREIISDLIVTSARRMEGGQYLAITPGQIKMADKDVNIIIVQNIDGTSVISELK